jgi:hypothetical protein
MTRRLQVTTLGALLVLGLAACGSSSNPASTNASATADAARLKFAQCMRQHGVDIPDNPGQGAQRGGGFRQAFQNTPRATIQAAMKACQKYRTQAFGNITPQQRQEFRDAFVKFAACMRRHGVDVPDPGTGGGPGAGGPPGGRRGFFNRNDPTVQTALKACRSQLPRPPGGGRFGPPGAGVN